MLETVKLYLKDFIELFYPKFCASCQEPLNSAEQSICVTCKFQFKRTNFHDNPENEIEKRFWGKISLAACTAYAQYIKDGLLQKAIYELKYKNNTEVGLELGRELGYQLKNSDRFSDMDLILPVPLHRLKKRRRGFNQCDFIAAGVSEALGCEWSDKYVKRILFNPSQTGKSTYHRHGNTKRIFESRHEKYLEDKRVLIVDDVITTGATMESCAHALKGIKGIKLYLASIAYA